MSEHHEKARVGALVRLQGLSSDLAGWSTVALLFAAVTSRALFNAAALFLILGLVLGGRYRERWEAAKSYALTPPALLMYAMIVLGALHTSAASTEVIDHWERYSKFLLIPAMLSVLHNPLWRSRAWYALLAALMLTLGSTFANIWWDLPWSITANQGWGQDHSVFANHIAQGLAMSFFFAVCMVKSHAALTLPIRLWWLGLALLSALSITHLSQGRGGQIALLAVMLVIVLRVTPVRWRWRSLLVLLLTVSALFSSSALLRERFSQAVSEVIDFQSGNNYTSAGARLRMWITSIDLIEQAPIVGHGTGAYHGKAAEAFDDERMCEIGCFHPHNQLLFFGVDHGLLGMALFLYFLWVPIRHSIRCREASCHMLSAFMAILLVDVLIHGPLWIHMEAYFFFTVLALLTADTQPTGPLRSHRV